MLALFASSLSLGSIYGTNTYPVTYQVLELIGETWPLFMLIVTTFYAGELIWREREARVAQMLDALPVPSWLPLLGKTFSLIGLQAVMLLVAMICGMLIQLFKGYFALEPGLYLQTLFLIKLPQYALVAVLAIALQVLINHKYLAYFAMGLYYAATVTFGTLGLDHPMILYGTSPDFIYSAMNGFGHFLARERWFELYWGGAALMLMVLSLVFWPRGYNAEFGSRLQLARRNLSMPVLAAFAHRPGACSPAPAACCTTTCTSPTTSRPPTRRTRRAPNTSSATSSSPPCRSRASPTSTCRSTSCPSSARLRVRGAYQLENRSAAPISEIFIQPGAQQPPLKLRFSPGARLLLADQARGFYAYRLASAAAAGRAHGARIRPRPTRRSGMLGLGMDTPVVANGTFFNNDVAAAHRLPGTRRTERRPRPQAPRPGAARADGGARPTRKAPANNYLASDADWINFDAVVSTSPDQIAIAPGTLEREWIDQGRRYFHYKMDKPILNFYAFQSARYEVRHERWQDVTIDVYYHPGHDFNLDRIIKGARASLDYNSANFSPYQHKVLRIVEFPRYAAFAQSFPNTIPFSESVGFIARVDDKNPKDIDYPFYVTAHEVAHQWWGHQLVGANTRGSTVLSETLAEYSALMVMKKAVGPGKMRRFLRYDLDHYLMGRAHGEQARTAAGAKRKPGLHPLPQGQPGDVPAAGPAGRRQGQRRAARAAGAPRLPCARPIRT